MRVKLLNLMFLDLDKSDKGLSILTSMYYKQFFDRATNPLLFLQNAKEKVLEQTLNCLREDVYILEMTERL